MIKIIDSSDFNFSEIRKLVEQEDAKYFSVKAEGESKSDWKFNRDSNPLDYLSLKDNERIVLVHCDEKVGGFAKISLSKASKTVFDVSVAAVFEYSYILPSMRGKGLSKPLNEGICAAIDSYIGRISDSFPMKRHLALTVSSIPVSPGGLMMTYRLKEMAQDILPKTKHEHILLKSVDFDIDVRQARFAIQKVRNRMTQELGYGN